MPLNPVTLPRGAKVLFQELAAQSQLPLTQVTLTNHGAKVLKGTGAK